MIQADLYRYCGRSFSQPELQLIRRLIAEHPDWSRFQISKNVCQTLQWLKDMSCRVALLRMQADGLIQLPLQNSQICLKMQVQCAWIREFKLQVLPAGCHPDSHNAPAV